MQREPDEISTYHQNEHIFLKQAVGILIMKNLKKQALAVIGGIAMIMNAGAASSSTTYASATIDWEHLRYYRLRTGIKCRANLYLKRAVHEHLIKYE